MTTIPTKMRAVLLNGHGDSKLLEYRQDVPTPKPRDHEVLVRVSAAGVNNTDINTRIGWYSKSNNSSEDASWSGNALSFPRIQGADVCGEVVAVGHLIDQHRIGERVLIEPCINDVNGESINPPWYFGSECDGGFAEYTVVSSNYAYKINSELSDIELASFPCSYSTAENMLTRSKVSKGDHVLISGASGGVGSAAIQLAKARGATVVAITSSSKRELVLGLGADTVVTRGDDLIKILGTNSIDVVIDLVAGDQWSQFLEVLRPKGRYAVSGAIGGPLVELDVRTLYLKDLSFFGCTVLEPGVFSNLVHKIEQGNIRPLVSKVFPLEAIHQAQAEFQEKKHVGKIVLTLK